MTKLSILTLTAILLSTPLAAQTSNPGGSTTSADTATMTPASPAIRHNAVIVAANGRKVGLVDRIRGDNVIVMTQGRLVAIPAKTLTADGTRFKTTLTASEIAHR